jgi:hypothetical protein
MCLICSEFYYSSFSYGNTAIPDPVAIGWKEEVTCEEFYEEVLLKENLLQKFVYRRRCQQLCGHCADLAMTS